MSIIIPVHGKLDYTLACLASVAEHAGQTPLEIIVVDDASPDDSADTLAAIPGLHLLRNERNLGFVGSCNAGAAAARGRWLLFLNNDTQVTAGWLEALLGTFDDFDRAGLVGARLVYPDGRLQEAGGLVFSDGSGWNYGRLDDPANPAYSYARPTHYCSGAAIMLEKQLFDRLGGFDDRYAPAYYEDTDLAFKVRHAGLQVVYQPAATVIHFEGVTSGTDTGSGIKRYQVINQDKFVAAWRGPASIRRREPGGTDRPQGPTRPRPGHRCDHARTRPGLARCAWSTCCACCAIPAATSPSSRQQGLRSRHSQRLQQMGIEVLYHPWLGHRPTGCVNTGPSWMRPGVPALYRRQLHRAGAGVRSKTVHLRHRRPALPARGARRHPGRQ